MNELTKEFRLITKENIVIIADKFSLTSKTIIGKDCDGYEFDTEQEMLDFIESEGFVYVEMA